MDMVEDIRRDARLGHADGKRSARDLSVERNAARTRPEMTRHTLLRGALAAPLLGARAVHAAVTGSSGRTEATALTRFADTAPSLERLRSAVVMRDGEIVLADCPGSRPWAGCRRSR